MKTTLARKRHLLGEDSSIASEKVRETRWYQVQVKITCKVLHALPGTRASAVNYGPETGASVESLELRCAEPLGLLSLPVF